VKTCMKRRPTSRVLIDAGPSPGENGCDRQGGASLAQAFVFPHWGVPSPGPAAPVGVLKAAYNLPRCWRCCCSAFPEEELANTFEKAPLLP